MALFLSLLTALFLMFGTRSVSHANPLLSPEGTSSTASSAQVQPVALESTNTRIVAVVPASAFPSCKNAVGGILYLTRVQQASDTTDRDDVITGPTCSMPSPGTAGAGTGEPLLVVPMTKEGKLSEQPCMVITAPQQFCEIPDGSLLSAYPMA